MRVCVCVCARAVALLLICITLYLHSDNSSKMINNSPFAKVTYYYYYYYYYCSVHCPLSLLSSSHRAVCQFGPAKLLAGCCLWTGFSEMSADDGCQQWEAPLTQDFRWYEEPIVILQHIVIVVWGFVCFKLQRFALQHGARVFKFIVSVIVLA